MRVSGDGDWVYLGTYDEPGELMLNREALPQLIEALRRLEAHLEAGGK